MKLTTLSLGVLTLCGFLIIPTSAHAFLVDSGYAISLDGQGLIPCAAGDTPVTQFLLRTDNTSTRRITSSQSKTLPCSPDQGSGSITIAGAAGVGEVAASVSTHLGNGNVTAEYDDQVNLSPPPNFTGTGITFGIAANFNITQRNGADATLLITTDQLAFALAAPIGNGTFTGLLQTPDITIPNCVFASEGVVLSMCHAEFSLVASAAAGGVAGIDGFASISDPVSFILPPGWTFTLASDAVNAAPEPGSALLVVTGLAGLAGHGWRRRRRTQPL